LDVITNNGKHIASQDMQRTLTLEGSDDALRGIRFREPAWWITLGGNAVPGLRSI
jgi:hypothetical protein